MKKNTHENDMRYNDVKTRSMMLEQADRPKEAIEAMHRFVW
jgi:hypothetical protein